MKNTTSPIVVTSKKARKELEDIKAKHAEILANLTNHSQKVAAYQQTKAQEAKQRDIEKQAQEREKVAANQKEQELSIKRQALSS